MAKKRSRKLQTARGAQAKSVARRRRRRNPDAPQPNPARGGLIPAGWGELAEFAIPGFAGYAGGRLVSRITFVQLQKKYPSAAKHLAAGAGLATVLAAYYALPKIKRFAQYQEPVVFGSAIAALQTLVQTYLPKFGWMVSDYTNGTTAITAAPQPVPMALTAEQLAMLDDDGLDDGSAESELDVDPRGPSYDATSGPMDDDELDDLGMN